LDSLRSAWTALSGGRRLVVVLATAAAFAAVMALARMSGSSEMALLYAGLDGTASGGVITSLDQRGVAYEVRGDAVYVPFADRDALRMALAGEGLPAGGTQGYELLDSLSGFGTTSQMFDAAYWRAKEGELARTILSVPGIATARVHISTAANRPFQREDRATAAVTVTMAGASLAAEQARALRFLVAAAVPGLSPADVAIIDGAGGLVSSDDADISGDTRAAELQGRAERLLAARVGYGNAVVELTVETVTETEQITERRLDPEGRVAIATEVDESTATTQDQGGGGAVTVASNLPDGDAGGTGGGSQSEDNTTRTLTNYEVSETSREVLRAPGAVRRLTVAVLVNDARVTAADGTVTTQTRSEEELATLRDLVASAVGFDEARGDVLTVRSMAFEPVAELGTLAGEVPGQPLDIMSLVRLGVLSAVALILGLFVIRPILASGRAPAAVPALPPPALGYGGAPAIVPGAALPAPPGFAAPALEAFDAGKSGPEDAQIVDPVTRLRRLIEERQDESLQILQSWIEEPDERERA
jgi:flagellar M-ring protein FliF